MTNFLVVFLILAMAGIYLPKAHAQFFFMESGLIGKPVPEFKLAKASGGSQSLHDFRQKKNTIVFFWATWCPHCREQLTAMNGKIEELSQKGIKVAAVNLGEKAGVVKSFVNKNKVKLDVFMDENSSLEEPYSLIGLPTLVFINQDGIVKAVKHSLPADVEKLFISNSVPIQ